MEDSYRHKGLREQLVESLRNKGIADEKVLEAIGKIPRHHFMDSSFVNFSYKDQAFPIAAGQTISQPYTVAFMTELLDVKTGNKVLEVGTGSGYQTAILLELGARVYTIERQKKLYAWAQEKLGELGYKPQFFHGDGFEGKPSYGPYDRIIVTAAARDIPDKLVKQMKIGGIMVVPVGDRLSQSMFKVLKTADDDYKTTKHGNFVFVPMLPGKE